MSFLNLAFPLDSNGNMFTSLGFRQLVSRSTKTYSQRIPTFFKPQLALNGASKKANPNYMLTAVGISSVTTGYIMAHKKIYNDSAMTYNGQTLESNVKSISHELDPSKPRYDGAFNGKLNYRQVAMGSTIGMAIGFCISRLSSVLFVLSLGVYLIGVYLKRQGIQFIDTKGVVKGAANSINWEELLFNQVSFSAPFILSFLFSAML